MSGNSGVQRQLRRPWQRRGVKNVSDTEIGGIEMQAPIVRRRNESVGITVDGRVQYQPAEPVTIGAEIGAPASKAEAKRNTGADRA